MGSRMPDVPLIPWMDGTLHPLLKKIIEQSKKSTSQQVLRTKMDVSKKRPKWPPCQDLSIPMVVWHFFLENKLKYRDWEKIGFPSCILISESVHLDHRDVAGFAFTWPLQSSPALSLANDLCSLRERHDNSTYKPNRKSAEKMIKERNSKVGGPA